MFSHLKDSCKLLLRYMSIKSDPTTVDLSSKKVFVTKRVPQLAVDILKRSGLKIDQWESDEVPRDMLLERVRGVDGLYCLLTDKIDKELLDAAGPQLKVISTMSVGFEHIDLKECKARGIVVGYTPDVLTAATAELCIALLLATSRRIVEGSAAVKSGGWQTWKPSWMCGQTLQGGIVGIVGLGRIGQSVATCLKPFGVTEIIYSSRARIKNMDNLAKHVPFDDLLDRSDFIIVTCSLNDTTRKMFNRDAFNKMKSNCVFVNVSRGAIVDQDDLYWALKNKVIWGAGLDVTDPEPLSPDSPLLTLENCVVLPHIGSATIKTRSAMAALTSENLLAGLKGHAMPAPLKL